MMRPDVCRIGIMARGELRCIGTSLRLKSRFGSGYNVSVRILRPDGEVAIIPISNGIQGEKPDGRRDPLTEARMENVKQVFMDRLGVKSGKVTPPAIHIHL